MSAVKEPATVNPSDFWETNNGNQVNWNSLPTTYDVQALTSANYYMGASLVSIKILGGSTSAAYTYTLAWATSVSSKTKPANNNYMQQWFSPQWNANASTGFVNYICSSQLKTGVVNATNKTTLTTTDLAVSGRNKGYQSTLQGTSTENGEFVTVSSTVATAADADGWYTSSCMGYRNDQDTNNQLASFTVGSAVTFKAGYKYLPTGASTTPISQSPALADVLTYTVLDAAVALTMTAATAAAVSTLAF